MRFLAPGPRWSLSGLLALSLYACGTPENVPPLEPLGPNPVLITPADGTQLTTDAPNFTVRNAQGYDLGQGSYTFSLQTQSGRRSIAEATVPAGRTTTTLQFAALLPSGMTLRWSVVARNSTGSAASTTATFKTPAVACLPGRDPYAKAVLESFVPACSLAQNIYNDPLAVLGPPDAGGSGPASYFGFMSLGDDGFVSVDMEGCAVDEPGPDVRVYQSVSREEVTLWAGGTAKGPWQLLGFRVECGAEERRVFSHYCDFDLGEAEVEEARYFKIEDGENFPCPGDTVTEGADIDAIKILHRRP